jgi:hypothetical protein
MVIDQIDDRVLEGAAMVYDMFSDGTAPALERRIAWAFDCARLDDVMYWLDVRQALYGQPL